MEPTHVAVIGFGYAGRRFGGALTHLAETDPSAVRLVGVCDVDADKLCDARAQVPAFADADHLVAETAPQAVVVAVNERDHAAVLARVAHWPSVELVMCEKPLVADLDELAAVTQALDGVRLSMNLVERHSPVLAAYHAWVRDQVGGVRPRRVEFFWGKDRLGDARPTMGVLSDVIHPLDVVDHLFGFDELEIRGAVARTSDFSPWAPELLDSIDFVATTGTYELVGHGSFTWDRRVRTVTAVLDGADGAIYRATFDFDMPKWDCDLLRVVRINPLTGHRTPVLDSSTHVDDLPEGLRGIGKVTAFVQESITTLRRGDESPVIVDLGQAVKLQRVLGQMECKLATAPVAHSVLLRRDPRT